MDTMIVMTKMRVVVVKQVSVRNNEIKVESLMIMIIMAMANAIKKMTIMQRLLRKICRHDIEIEQKNDEKGEQQCQEQQHQHHLLMLF